MFGYVCDYALVSPAVLASRLEATFGVLVSWEDRDEESFFLSVWAPAEMQDAVDAVVAPYFYKE